jgi:uncharacterized protein (DUF1800 family)
MDARLQALNRFGLGARVGQPQSIRDPRGWLVGQLTGGGPAIEAPVTRDALEQAIDAFRSVGQGNRQARQQARRRLMEIALAEARAALSARVASERPFVERLVAFWSNHLCVSTAAKVIVAPVAGSYEREVIRPHVLGRFEDMVLASAKHPAMLFYLDNFQSTGPSSIAAKRPGRGRGGAGRGLNENYARELLELHTLGVNGGYTQQDVIELAKMLTGWSVSGLNGGTLGFVFEPRRHEPGPRTVLGVSYREGGVEQGEQAIRDFCRHPSTATFVANKLVSHFVADVPPPDAVKRVAAVFTASKGDLRQVAQALVELPQAWEESARKFRTPQEWLVAVLRGFGAQATDARVVPVLRQLRQPLWAPDAPKGYSDAMQDWADPDSLLNRAELARTLVRRVTVDPQDLLEVVDVPAGDPLRKMASDRSIPAADRLALVIAGPGFQWR